VEAEHSGGLRQSSIERLPEQTLRFVEGMRRDGSRFYQAKLRLNPPELGHMKVELRMENEQLQARFIVEHQAARDQVQAELPRLRAALFQQDLSDARIDVQIDQGEAQAGHGKEGAGDEEGARDTLEAWSEEQAEETITVRTSLHEGLIDIRA
jgi:flagellar hook-length control protein FliK